MAESTIKQLRREKRITQAQIAAALGVSLRTYKRYEADASKLKPLTRQTIDDYLRNTNYLDETHGILSLAEIKRVCRTVFDEYAIKCGYLFGSYAKGKATPASDVDLLVVTDLTGLKFYELAEVLREKLHKKVDLLNQDQLTHNPELLTEILIAGIKIYG